MLELDILPEECEGCYPLQPDLTENVESIILLRHVQEMRNHAARKRVIVLFSCDKVIIHFRFEFTIGYWHSSHFVHDCDNFIYVKKERIEIYRLRIAGCDRN